MRVLIFGEVILPPAYMPRVRYFSSYFIEKGWEVDYILEASGNESCIPDKVSVLAVDYYKNKQGILFKIEWLLKFILNFIFDFKGYYFYRKSQSFLREKDFDIVFCSSCFTFPLTVAARAAKALNAPLFVDLRDIAEQSPDDNHYLSYRPSGSLGKLIIKYYKKSSLNRRNKVLKVAAGVTTVSPWHVQTLSQYNFNTHLIYNGYDEKLFIPQGVKTEKFVISYFGRVYNERMRNPYLLFEAIKNLKEKGTISSQNFVVNWFVDENSKKVIQKNVMQSELEDFVKYHDFIEPNNLSVEMNKSSVLLVLCSQTTEKKYFGIMTTKFFEAIGVNRPILCIPDNNDNLSDVIRKTNCGLVTSDVLAVENFLLEKILEWQETNEVKGKLDEGLRETFSRKKGAEVLESLFLETLEKNKKENI